MSIIKKSETDLAIEILSKNHEAMFYRDLIQEIAARMGRNLDEATLSVIYTRLNLDNRLIYQGDGYWYFDSNRLKRGTLD